MPKHLFHNNLFRPKKKKEKEIQQKGKKKEKTVFWPEIFRLNLSWLILPFEFFKSIILGVELSEEHS